MPDAAKKRKSALTPARSCVMPAQAEAMYCFTDSMRPLVSGPFSDEIIRFFDQQSISVLSHTARWSGAVQFVHAVSRTPGVHEEPTSLMRHVTPLVEPPVNSYAPERAVRDVAATPSFNNSWCAPPDRYSYLDTRHLPHLANSFCPPILRRIHAQHAHAQHAHAHAPCTCTCT